MARQKYASSDYNKGFDDGIRTAIEEVRNLISVCEDVKDGKLFVRTMHIEDLIEEFEKKYLED